jgi:uroporphyrinogen decarboxylase
MRHCTMESRERFINACCGRPVDRPPVWLMRQAGRALPEYRALKQKHSFLDLVRTPELATEVTLQPVRRFGFDAAILFSDILVVPEALGQPYQFRDTGGIEFAFALRTAQDLARLKWEGLIERAQYVADALRLVKAELGQRTALLGFAGSPWTLANFMIEGGSSRGFTRAQAWYREDRRTFDRFLDKLATAVADYLKMQIAAGADAVQVFDSLAHLVDPPESGEVLSRTAGEDLYQSVSARWIEQIMAELAGQVPVILFSRGHHWPSLAALSPDGTRIISVDWTVDLAEVRSRLPAGIGIQGNLDPAVLNADPATVAGATGRILATMNGRRGYIFNLGHGLPPTAKVENIAQLVETIQKFAWLN